MILDEAFNVFVGNSAFYRTFRTSAKDTLNQKVFELGNRQWDIAELRQVLENFIPQGKPIEGYEMEADFSPLGRRKMSLSARWIEIGEKQPGMILLNFKDIT